MNLRDDECLSTSHAWPVFRLLQFCGLVFGNPTLLDANGCVVACRLSLGASRHSVRSVFYGAHPSASVG